MPPARPVILAIALLLTPAATRAAGLNLAWDTCLNGGGPTAKTFACDDNAAPAHTLFLSATAPAGITQWVSFDWEIGVLSLDDADLPDWWYVRGTGMCRNGALTAVADPASATGCDDLYQGQAVGGIVAYTVTGTTAIRGRMLGVWSVPQSFAAALDEDVEYFVSRVSVSNLKTTGADACAGCSVGGCLAAVRVTFVQLPGAPGGNVVVVVPANRSVAGWQGDYNNNNDCGTCQGGSKAGLTTCAICPSQNVTWGRLKALYR